MLTNTNIDERRVRKRRVSGARELVLLAVGFGCMVGYARMLSLGFIGYVSEGAFASSDPWYGLRSAASLVTLALLAFAGWRRLLSVSTPIFMGCVSVAIACAIAFAVDGGATLGWAIAVAGGASVAVLMYVWMLLLSCYDVKAIMIATLGGLVVSGAIMMGVPYLDSALALVVAVLAAFVAGSSAVLLDGDLISCVPDGPLGEAVVRVPWLTVVMILACGFLATVLYGIAGQLTWLYDWSPNYIAFGVAVVCVVGSTVLIMVRFHAWQHVVWIPPFAVLTLALVFSCFSIRESIQIAVGLVLASVFCAHFLHWMVFPALLSTLRVPRAFLASVVLICVNGSLASALGDILGAALPHSVQNLGGVSCIIAVILGIVLVVSNLFYRRAFGVLGLMQMTASPEMSLKSGETVRMAQERERNVDAQAAGSQVDSGVAEAAGGTDVDAAKEEEDASDAGNLDSEPSSKMDAEPRAAELVVSPTDAPASDVSSGNDGQSTGADGGGVGALDIMKVRVEELTAEYGLTPREEEVAFLTAQGFSCAYIADKLVVSESTVRFHQRNLYRKLDVHSRNELIELVNEAV